MFTVSGIIPISQKLIRRQSQFLKVTRRHFYPVRHSIEGFSPINFSGIIIPLFK